MKWVCVACRVILTSNIPWCLEGTLIGLMVYAVVAIKYIVMTRKFVYGIFVILPMAQ